MNNTPLYDAIDNYIKKDMSRLHMPGHKGADIFNSANLLRYDVTEVDGTDSLYHASEAIAQTEAELAALYGSTRTVISASGSTLCIQAMLALVARPGAKIIAGRNIHRSAVNAMALLDISPVWVYPKTNIMCGGIISPDDIKQALISEPNAAAVYVTSPDYFGNLCDIKSIADICRNFDVPLLVDNAHGSHLKFLPTSQHPIDLGAAICCDSLHKTLPVLTGGALRHIADERFAQNAKNAMSIFGTTSPSYLIMLSIDLSIDYIKNNIKSDLICIADWVDKAKKLAKNKGFGVIEKNCDPCRLSLDISKAGFNAVEFGRYIRSRLIEPEMLNDCYCVLLPSVFNSERDFKRIEKMIADAEIKKSVKLPEYTPEKPIQAISMKQAMLSARKLQPLSVCEGRIAADINCPCPPAVPLVMYGELIDKNMIEILKNYGTQQLYVVQ